MKLLVIEDSQAIRNSLLRLLCGLPGLREIHTADTLANALRSADKVRPSLVILDFHLPDGNALQIISPLKQLTPDLKIAIFSSEVNPMIRDACLESGADWFFDKSNDIDPLLDVVQRQARPRSATHEL